MKAWNELTNNNDRSLFWTEHSEWYLDMGVKIERFHEDGRIEIKNVMTSTDRFEDVSDEILDIFHNDGWMAGCMNVNIEVHQAKLLRINNLIKASISTGKLILVDGLIVKRLLVQKKINKCRNLLTKND